MTADIYDLTGFTFTYGEGASDTPALMKALVDELTLSGFKRSSRGITVITVDGTDYMAEVDGKLKHITIGLCEYETSAPLDAGPFKGKQVMMPRMKKRLDG